MEFIKNKIPKLKLPEFIVDTELNPKLSKFGGILKLMNKSNFTLFLGKAGSGKTSLMVGLLGSKPKNGGLKKVFHQIFVFIPPSSRHSMKENFFEKYLPEEQIFDELNLSNLELVYDLAKENAKEGYRSLLVFDDVQKDLKDECKELFLSIVNNRRHAKINIMLLCQNYFSIPKQIRNGITDAFIFKVSKNEMEQIFQELIEKHKNKFIEILDVVFKEKHSFLYINTESQRIFSNFENEIVFRS